MPAATYSLAIHTYKPFLVNVYVKPEKRYEVRSEDNAVDVQIHE